MKQAEEMIEAIKDWVKERQGKAISDIEKAFLKKTGDASKVTNAFSKAGSRTLPASGESLDITLGKILRYLSDLATVAFSGEYKNIQHRAIYLDSYIANYNYAEHDETILLASAREDRVYLIIGNGGSRTSSSQGATDFARAYLVVPKIEASSVSNGKGRTYMLLQICSTGSTARYTLTAVAAENSSYNNEKIILKIPKGSYAEVAIYRLYAYSMYVG